MKKEIKSHEEKTEQIETQKHSRSSATYVSSYGNANSSNTRAVMQRQYT